MYDPTLGRWLEQDPAGFPDGLNRYRSEMSDPVNGLDPMGMETEYGDWMPCGDPQPFVKGHFATEDLDAGRDFGVKHDLERYYYDYQIRVRQTTNVKINIMAPKEGPFDPLDPVDDAELLSFDYTSFDGWKWAEGADFRNQVKEKARETSRNPLIGVACRKHIVWQENVKRSVTQVDTAVHPGSSYSVSSTTYEYSKFVVDMNDDPNSWVYGTLVPAAKLSKLDLGCDCKVSDSERQRVMQSMPDPEYIATNGYVPDFPMTSF